MSSLELSRITEEYRIKLPTGGFEAATFLLLNHHDENDLPLDTRPLFEHADIVFHERVAWWKEDVDDLNSVAQGSTNISMHPHPLNERITDLIKDTGAFQLIWDVPAGHLSAPHYIEYLRSVKPPVGEEAFRAYYQAAVGRDKLALRTVGTQIDRAVSSGRVRERPRILLIAGLSHLLLANAYKQTVPESVTITSPFGDDIPLSAPTEYVKQRLEGTSNIDILELSARAVHEEILARKGVRPSHAIAERAKLDSFPTPGFVMGI